MNTHVLVVGEALVDIVRDPDGTEREYCGGSPANVAVTLGRLGRACKMATTIGQDPRGERVRTWLQESGVEVSSSPPLNGRTSTAAVILDSEGGATYDFDLVWDIDEVDLVGADTVHVGSVSVTLSPGAETVRDAVRRARSHAVISLDPNVRPALMRDAASTRDRIEELVALADVVKVSDEDLAWVQPGFDPVEVARRWAERGPGLVVVTHGGEGASVVRADGSVFEVPGRLVRVIDTVGAGDTFCGALIDALAGMGIRGPEGRNRLRGLSDAAVRRAVHVAAAAASITVSRPGADPPDQAELASVLGPARPPTLPGGPVAGMTWGWTGIRGTWEAPAAQESMDRLAELGSVNWVAISYAALQTTAQSTEIRFEEEPTVSDDEVRGAIRAARARGWKICLKPVVDCADGTWRAHIGFFDQAVPGEPSWEDWFASYTRFIEHYARIAAEEGVEMFCVGCEMVRSDSRETEWRELVRRVREIYSGLVTYNCDKYQEDRLTWWDAVDVISSSGYYPSGTWLENLDRIERVVAREGKPFVFLEAGCPSRVGSSARPNDWNLVGAPSGAEQAEYLGELFSACAERPWVSGFFIWDWPAGLYPMDEAALNDDYCVFGKPGAAVVDRAYRLLEHPGESV